LPEFVLAILNSFKAALNLAMRERNEARNVARLLLNRMTKIQGYDFNGPPENLLAVSIKCVRIGYVPAGGHEWPDQDADEEEPHNKGAQIIDFPINRARKEHTDAD
jgi:hypothetical protein